MLLYYADTTLGIPALSVGGGEAGLTTVSVAENISGFKTGIFFSNRSIP